MSDNLYEVFSLKAKAFVSLNEQTNKFQVRHECIGIYPYTTEWNSLVVAKAVANNFIINSRGD